MSVSMFLSSEHSTTFHEVLYDESLFQALWGETIEIYGKDQPKRPTHLPKSVSAMKAKLSEFTKDNVCFVAEFPSLRSIPCEHGSQASTSSAHHYSHRNARQDVYQSQELHLTEEILTKSKTCVTTSYELCRILCTQLLVFMLSNLDRYIGAVTHSVPVAYALPTNSLPNKVFADMLTEVLIACENAGLYVPATCTDAAFHRTTVRDSRDQPLTRHQVL